MCRHSSQRQKLELQLFVYGVGFCWFLILEVFILYWHGISVAVLLKGTLHHIHMQSDTKVIKRDKKQINDVGGFSVMYG